MASIEMECIYKQNIAASIDDICHYTRDYAKSLEENRSGYTTGWGKWNAIDSTTLACKKFYSGAKKIKCELTDNCVVDLCELARSFYHDLIKINLLHEPTTDDIDLMAKVRAFEITATELTRVYLEQLRQQKRALKKRKFNTDQSGQLAYLTYKVDQVKQIKSQLKQMYN